MWEISEGDTKPLHDMQLMRPEDLGFREPNVSHHMAPISNDYKKIIEKKRVQENRCQRWFLILWNSETKCKVFTQIHHIVTFNR